MKHPHLKGAKVALVAMGRSHLIYSMSLCNSFEYDEVWGINAMAIPFKVDRLFMMDPVTRFLDMDVTGKMTGGMRKILTEKQPYPIYSSTTDERCPSVEQYPLEEVISATGLCYFNNTVPYALGYALYQEVGEIFIYGVDYTYSDMRVAEPGRACTEFWCAILAKSGVKLQIAPESSLLDTNVPPTQKMYGYHLLPDPLYVDFSNNDEVTISKVSNIMRPPTPGDSEDLPEVRKA